MVNCVYTVCRMILSYRVSARKGSSEKLAKMLAEKLPGETVLANVKENPSSKGYDNVILGGAVLAGEIKNGMRKFAESQLNELKNCKVALFCSCLSVDNKLIKDYFIKSFPPELIEQAVAMESLGGVYAPEKENFLMRSMFKLMKATAQENIRQENIDKIARCFSEL